ncbi:PREDICTED: chaperone protein dnaJ 49-like [Tarenaya hassleriana]|uniref:chaperone protein dnaJ 49-like n=1 Tax=Tarenaya hassleriana TaxID=28532 RepID=UPI00053C832D|nr:PREDICTED: chaperone protein dnaJ 49-like [Tarenaya hassleriana]
MDGNKDEALRCLRIAKDAIASGYKGRAVKFINMAKRLYPSLSADELVSACEKLDSVSMHSPRQKSPESVGKVDRKRDYTKENVELIRHIRRNNDYYKILGVEKSCSVDEIRKAYRKLSLKVHPDKNKAPGSEEAFKKVSKAFTCLSDGNSRRQYDQVDLVDEFDHVQGQYHSRPRKRTYTQKAFFEDDFIPDEIFRAFFGQGDMFRESHAYRTRQTRNQPRQEEPNGGGPSRLTILQILPFLLVFSLAYLPFSVPDYSLHKNMSYQIPKTTQNLGISFYVKSPSFDEKFPLGSSARASIEDNVIKDYRKFLFHSCRIQLQKRRWNKKLSTPRRFFYLLFLV